MQRVPASESFAVAISPLRRRGGRRICRRLSALAQGAIRLGRLVKSLPRLAAFLLLAGTLASCEGGRLPQISQLSLACKGGGAGGADADRHGPRRDYGLSMLFRLCANFGDDTQVASAQGESPPALGFTSLSRAAGRASLGATLSAGAYSAPRLSATPVPQVTGSDLDPPKSRPAARRGAEAPLLAELKPRQARSLLEPGIQPRQRLDWRDREVGWRPRPRTP